jgi:hypothetical protein
MGRKTEEPALLGKAAGPGNDLRLATEGGPENSPSHRAAQASAPDPLEPPRLRQPKRRFARDLAASAFAAARNRHKGVT